MDKFYDLSHNDYCVSIGFDEDYLYSRSFDSGSKQGVSPFQNIQQRASGLFDIGSKKVLALGVEAEKRKCEDNQNNIFYTNNIFLELYNNYLKKRFKSCKPALSEANDQASYTDDTYEMLVQQGVKRSLQHLQKCDPSALIRVTTDPDMHCHYAITLPTIWEMEVREELIRPLFIEAGLIAKHDSPSRLLFFSQLESDFRYIQSLNSDGRLKTNSTIKHGQQYIMCELKLTQNELLVNVDLFSAHYPPITTSTDDSFKVKLLESTSFAIALDLEIKQKIEKTLKKHGFAIQTDGNMGFFMPKIYSNSYDFTITSSYDKIHNSIGWCACLAAKKISVFKSRVDGYYEMSDCILKIILDKMTNLPQHTGNSEREVILKLRDSQFTEAGGFDHQLLLDNLKEEFRDLCENSLHCKIMTFGYYSEHGTFIEMNNTLYGSTLQIQYQLEILNSQKPPMIMSENKTVIRSPSLVEYPRKDLVIDLVISFNSICFTFSSGKNCNHIKTFKYSKCNVNPLNTFFVQKELYQYPLLKIDIRLKTFMDKQFKIYLNYKDALKKSEKKKSFILSSFIDKLKRKSYKLVGSSLEINREQIQEKDDWHSEEPALSIRHTFSVTNELDVFFSKFSATSTSENVNQKHILIRQREYIQIFLIMYLVYLENLAKKQAKVDLGYKEDVEKFECVISIEKILLNKMLGSGDTLKENFTEGVLATKIDVNQKTRVTTQGEDILPAIQDKLGISLGLKTFFVVAHIQANYVQLTLHQVVKTAAEKENASTIIVHDEIIHTDNVYESLCKNIWCHVQANKESNDCFLNTVKGCSLHESHLSKDYKHLFSLLKLHVSEVLASSKESTIDMDFQSEIKIDPSTCDCSLYISLRNIFHIGMKPTMQHITTIIASSLVNTSLFGNYKVDNIFGLGNIYDMSSNCPIHQAYIKTLNNFIAASIESKGKDTQGYFFKESLDQLLQQTHGNIPRHEKLYQVYDESYGIYIKDIYPYQIDNDLYLSYTSPQSGKKVNLREGFAAVVIQKGQQILNTGFSIQFNLENMDWNPYGLNLYNLSLVFVKIRNLDHAKSKDVLSLEGLCYDPICAVKLSNEELTPGSAVQMEFKYHHYNSSLRVALKKHGDGYDYQDKYKCAVLTKHLTVAYF